MARTNYLAICLFRGTISGIVDIKGRSEESARGAQGSAAAPSNVPETASQKRPKSNRARQSYTQCKLLPNY